MLHKFMDIQHGRRVRFCSGFLNSNPTYLTSPEYRLSDNSQRLMDIVTNTFCAVRDFLVPPIVSLTSRFREVRPWVMARG